ncbi:MAG: hypothetical protein JSU86_13070 [Phycisphaerales bacterium]|nr:MAG: hypothetical protein JSU86_13070 [Phycisphaerales bacterium]
MKVVGAIRNRVKPLSGVAAFTVGLIVASDTALAGHARLAVLRHGVAGRVPSVYATVARTIEEAAVFEDRATKVWHEPVYEDRRILLELPAEVVTRDVPRYDVRGRLIGYDIVRDVVEPARKVWQTEKVLVRPGYFETVYKRVLVRPASTRVIYEKILVRPGHRASGPRLLVRKTRPYSSVIPAHRRLSRWDRGLHLAVRFGG